MTTLFPVRSYRIPTSSMAPALLPGDHLIADLTRWRKHTPKRGDFVIFESPEAAHATVIKRILAIAGERLEIRKRVVLIDGQPLAHDRGMPRAADAPPATTSGPAVQLEDFGPVEIPPGTFFALGDNRENRWDSRFYGPVPNKLLRGQPLYLYWAEDKSRIGRRIR